MNCCQMNVLHRVNKRSNVKTLNIFTGNSCVLISRPAL